MELTDEQYKLVFRYVDGEMDIREKNAFEASLAENKELSEEVEFYKEVRFLSGCIDQKLSNSNLLSTPEKEREEEVLLVLSQARKNWEADHEDALKFKYAIPVSSNNIHQPLHDKAKGITPHGTLFETEINNIKLSGAKDLSSRRTSTWKWLAAAIFLGFVSVGIAWWLSQNGKELSRMAAQNKQEDSQIVNPNNNNKADRTENQTRQPSLAEAESTPSKDILKKDQSKISEPVKHMIGKPAKKRKSNAQDKASLEALFASNFRLDSTPDNAESRLRKAFVHYNAGDYENTILSLNESEMLVKRGFDENRKLTRFYTHYYRGQSYMAMDKIPEATVELKTAVVESPNQLSKSKTQWYLALAYLKAGDVDEAERFLKELVKDPSREFNRKAMTLLNALERKD